MNATPNEIIQNVTITVDAKRLSELNAEVPRMSQLADGFEISDSDSYEAALPLIQTFIERQNIIKQFFKETKDLAFKTHRSVCAMETVLLEPYVSAEKLIATKRLEYSDRMERERVAREKEKTAKLAKDREEQELAKAAELEQIGAHEEAEQVVTRATQAPRPAYIEPSNVPKQKGAATRGRWEFVIDDPNIVQREFCDPSEKKIRSHVEAYGDNHNIKGVRAQFKKTEAFKRS
jgi:uncharacterized protein YdaU (DUF1376 family)